MRTRLLNIMRGGNTNNDITTVFTTSNYPCYKRKRAESSRQQIPIKDILECINGAEADDTSSNEVKFLFCAEFSCAFVGYSLATIMWHRL